MSEVNVELDGKKTWPGIEYLEGALVGVALQTNDALANGDGIPSLKLRVTLSELDNTPDVLVDVKIAFLIQLLAAVRGRLEHLQSIKDMISSVQ